jgi:hypothetical protein
MLVAISFRVAQWLCYGEQVMARIPFSWVSGISFFYYLNST